MRRLVVAALVIATATAGCLSEGGDAQPEKAAAPEDPGQGNQGAAHDPNTNGTGVDALGSAAWMLDWQDCEERWVSSHAQASERDETLPENYSATGPDSVLSLIVITCAATVLDNETVLPAVSGAFLATLVSVDSSVEHASAVEYYAYAFWSDSAVLAAHMKTAGMPRIFETSGFTVASSESGLDIAIEVGGSPVIEVIGGPNAQHSTSTSSVAADRIFYGEGDYRWFDAEHAYTEQMQPFLRPVLITYHPEWLQDIAAQPAETTAAEAAELHASHIELARG